VPKSTSRAALVGAVLLGLAMVASGVTKLVREPHQVAMFALVGLPNWFLALVGTFEVIGGTLLIIPMTTPMGSLILSTIMVGALWAHAAQREWVNLLPVGVLLAMFLAIFRSARWRSVQLLGGEMLSERQRK
jgi:putative oxidoreductase